MSNDNKKKVTRKLRAILSADVKGYSLLMADDEVHTIQTLKAYRQIMSDLIGQHSGRVVDNPGDNLLAEFGSAVDAVECSVQIQNRLKKENARYVEDNRLEFRIGVNIGDVVHDDDRIYGEGVNIAARIESLADAGGICISRSTYDQIKNKLDMETEYLGEHEVKNIKEPVRVYKVLMGTDAPKPLVEEQLELPDIPSIAVLPFDNMSGDPGQEYFSDGLTEQIINGLCKVSNLFVIARNSSFAYKGKSISVKQIAKELGVRYILEGSVQRAGNRVRITAQLIDATTDYHMWSESYDRDLEDIFALQDEITMKLISEMEINLVFGEQARLWAGGYSSNIEAYTKIFQSVEFQNLFTKQDIRQSIKLAKEAVSLDDSCPFAYVVLGTSHWLELSTGWSSSVAESFAHTERCSRKALELSDSYDWAHLLAACIHMVKHEFDDAIKEGETALRLNPNGADAHAVMAFIYSFYGLPNRAIELFTIAFRLNPIPPSWYYHNLAFAHFMVEDYSKTIDDCLKCLMLAPDSIFPHLLSAASYAELGETIKANDSAKEILRINPVYSIKKASNMMFNKPSDLNNLVDALRKAGIPEHSPK